MGGEFNSATRTGPEMIDGAWYPRPLSYVRPYLKVFSQAVPGMVGAAATEPLCPVIRHSDADADRRERHAPPRVVSAGASQSRTLQKNVPLLILDEVTSALDSEPECLAQAALETLMKDRTTIERANRLEARELQAK